MVLFKELKDYVETNFNAKLTLSEMIKNLKQNEIVVVGGKITSIMRIEDEGPVYITLDDDIGTTDLCFTPNIYKELADRIKFGNIVVAKGKIRVITYPKKDNIENLGGTYKQLMCFALTVIKENKNE